MADQKKPLVFNFPPPLATDRRHPCDMGRHRPAYLASGGIACGYCGVRLG